MSTTKIAYTGAAPGADSNSYVLVDTSEAFPVKNFTDMACVKRCVVSIVHAEDGTLILQRSDDRGANWQTVRSQAITAGTDATVGDFLVAGLPDWRIVWTNGGSAQTTWEVDVFVHEDISPSA